MKKLSIQLLLIFSLLGICMRAGHESCLGFTSEVVHKVLMIESYHEYRDRVIDDYNLLPDASYEDKRFEDSKNPLNLRRESLRKDINKKYDTKKSIDNVISIFLVLFACFLILLSVILPIIAINSRSSRKKEEREKEKEDTLRRKAHEGDADAQYKLGRKQERCEVALMWCIKSAKQGHKLAAQYVVLQHPKAQQDILKDAELAANLEVALAFFEANDEDLERVVDEV